MTRQEIEDLKEDAEFDDAVLEELMDLCSDFGEDGDREKFLRWIREEVDGSIGDDLAED